MLASTRVSATLMASRSYVRYHLRGRNAFLFQAMCHVGTFVTGRRSSLLFMFFSIFPVIGAIVIHFEAVCLATMPAATRLRCNIRHEWRPLYSSPEVQSRSKICLAIHL